MPKKPDQSKFIPLQQIEHCHLWSGAVVQQSYIDYSIYQRGYYSKMAPVPAPDEEKSRNVM